MNNPYDLPASAGSDLGGGSLDVWAAITTGVGAVGRNLLVWVGALLAAGLAFGISFVMCLAPALIVWPVVSWGLARFYVDAIDGEASLDTVFLGFQRIGDVLPQMLAYMCILLFVALGVSLPFTIAQYVVDAFVGVGAAQLVIDTVLNLFGSVIQTWISLRLGFAGYLIADRGLGAVDALSASWEMTRGARIVALFGLTMVIGLATVLCMAPGVGVAVVGVWSAALAMRMPNVAEVAVALAGFALAIAGSIPPAVVGSAAFAACYRQLVPKRAARAA